MHLCRSGSTDEKPGMPEMMILPSLSCQAGCKYCFGPHKGAVMDERTAREAASLEAFEDSRAAKEKMKARREKK